MLKSLNAALVALSLICPGTAAAQGQPDPSAAAAAMELVILMRVPDGLIHSLPGMLQVLKPLVIRGKPEFERNFDVAAPVVIDAMKARMDEFMAPIAGVYARNFTVSEMREIAAFYRTPAGQKFLDKQVAVAEETGVLSQNMGHDIGREMHERMIEELRKLGQKL